MYLDSLAAIRSSQGGLQYDVLSGCGFRSVAARMAAWGAVYDLPRSAGVVFGPWLLCKAARGVSDLPRSAGPLCERGFRSLAARAAARGAVYGVPRSASVLFVPWLLCEAAREGLPFLSLPPFFFCLLIQIMYLGSLAATRSSQGGLRSAALGGRGFRALAARAAARGAVYSLLRSAGVFFGPWLRCEAAGECLLFLSLPPTFF